MQRFAIVVIAAALTGVMGVRGSRGRATAFGDIELQGMGRATLTVEATEPAPAEGTTVAMEVFARMIYASELSQFGRGLYVRSTFSVPATGETGVLVIDVDRSSGRKRWEAGSDALKARFYTLASKEARGPRFDGMARSGSATLEASVVGTTRAGFRIKGFMEFRDGGPDGVADTGDDAAFEVAFTLESVPPPEQITGQTPPPPPRPTGGICDPTWCWQDDGYYDGYYWYGPGCGDAEVGYETTDGGCESDPYDEPVVDEVGGGGGGVYDPYAPDDTVTSDGGCGSTTSDDSGTTSSGCEGTDDSSGTTSDGCDGGDDSSSATSGCADSGSSGSSGCSDSGSSGSSGCSDSSSSGCSGCEGDTLERAPAPGQGGLRGDVGWIAVAMFLGSLGAAARRRDD